MAFAKTVLAAVVACRATAQEATMLLQSSAERNSEALGPAIGQLSVVESFGGEVMDDSPEWCKNETQLTWKQRKQRMQQHATLEWCRSQVKDLRAKNDTVPDWMQKIVEDDEKKGKMKWAAEEYKELREKGKGDEAPAWMVELAAESDKWSNRWASCKAAELKSRHEEVPKWMDDNAHKGIMDYAAEKAQEIQMQINELEAEREQEEALVHANGDMQVASQRMLARDRTAKTQTVSQQFRALEEALGDLGKAEEDVKTRNNERRRNHMKQAAHKAKDAMALLNRMLDNKIAWAAAHE